jgi:O-antigen/teichoic acid export membrane protein
MLKFRNIIEKIKLALSRNPLWKRFIKGAFWSAIGTFATMTLNFAASLITARILGKVGLGEFMMITNTVWTIGIFAGLGLGMSATKYVAEYKDKQPEKSGRILGLLNTVVIVSSGLLTLFVFIFSPYLAGKTLNAPHLTYALRISSVLLLLNALTGLQTGILSGFEAFKASAWVNLWSGISRFVLMIAGVYFFGLMGAVVSTAIIGVITWLLNEIAIKKEFGKYDFKILYRELKTETPVLWEFSLPALLGTSMVGPAIWLANTILVNQPGGYGEMGLLSAANQWQTLLLFLPAIFEQVALPIMCSESTGECADENVGKTLVLAQNMTVFAVFPVATILMFISDWIIKLYGKTFSDGSSVFVLVIGSIMIISVGKALGPMIMAKNKMWIGLLINGLWGLTFVGLSWLLAPHLGAKAIAISFAASYLVNYTVSFIYLLKDIPPGLIKRVSLSTIYIILLTLICFYMTPAQRIYSTVPALILTFITTLFIFISSDFRRSILKTANR